MKIVPIDQAGSPIAFTVRYSGLVNKIVTPVTIFPAFNPQTQNVPSSRQFEALYDTGATHSSISPKVVAELNLPVVGAIKVGVGGGHLETTTHLVTIGLPNNVMFGIQQVAQIQLHGGIDVLIGMDIIGRGDFVVSSFGGKTTFSYCVPPRREVDFVGEVNDTSKKDASNASVPLVSPPQQGRNSPCKCASGKKFKQCCGR
jgi:hypothetical protein